MTPTLLLTATYDDAWRLLHEARHYVAYEQRGDRRRLAPEDGLVLSCESLRLTARLTQVMAWLLTQRAFHAGEISREEACAEENRLGGLGVCLDEGVAPLDGLSPRLALLMRRSLELYRRVQRLDALLDAGSRLEPAGASD